MFGTNEETMRAGLVVRFIGCAGLAALAWAGCSSKSSDLPDAHEEEPNHLDGADSGADSNSTEDGFSGDDDGGSGDQVEPTEGDPQPGDIDSSDTGPEPDELIWYSTVEPWLNESHLFPYSASHPPATPIKAGDTIYLLHSCGTYPECQLYPYNRYTPSWTIEDLDGNSVAVAEGAIWFFRMFHAAQAGTVVVRLTLTDPNGDTLTDSLTLQVGACQSSCAGKQCGGDGCWGNCGVCPSEQACVGGTCVDGWVQLQGGEFLMGAPEGEGTCENYSCIGMRDGKYCYEGDGCGYPADVKPEHTVTVPSFQLLRTEVTVGQYHACVEAGVCTPAQNIYTWDMGRLCNSGRPGRDSFPVNCVNAFEAETYCAWIGARLPTEAEWEYAAQSAQDHLIFPWGSEFPTCDRIVMAPGPEVFGCSEYHTFQVCSRPSSNTSQGICDMLGSVSEWTQDCWHDNYDNAPTDGSAWLWDHDPTCGRGRVYRGSSFMDQYYAQYSEARWQSFPAFQGLTYGIRCAKSM